mgnify:CR=1 FL=1
MIEKGSKGTEVANWQRLLISQGYNIEADGDFGKATDIATKDFQVAHGLRADGKVGDMTYKAAESLKVDIGSQKPVDVPASSSYNETKLAQVHPALAHRARKLIAFAKADGYELRVTQGLRTFKEQDDLFKKRPKVTNARGGQSYHNYGLAVDFAFVVNGKISWDDKLYTRIGKWALNAGLEWGGGWRKFKDMPHVQLPGLPNYKTLLPIFQKSGLAAVWSKFN